MIDRAASVAEEEIFPFDEPAFDVLNVQSVVESVSSPSAVLCHELKLFSRSLSSGV